MRLHPNVIIIGIVVSFLLSGCSSTSTTSASNQTSPSNIPALPVIAINTPQPIKYIEAAREAERKGNLPEAFNYLLQAANIYSVKGQCLKTHAILSAIPQQNHPSVVYLRVLCNHPNDDVKQQLTLLDNALVEPRLKSRIHHLKSVLYLEILDYKNALIHYAQGNEYDVKQAWQITQSIPDNKLNTVGVMEVDAHLSLMQALRQYGLEPTRLATALRQWRNQFSASQLVQNEAIALGKLLDYTAFPETSQVAVLLPLKGRFANSAEQIKMGIMAAYLNANANYSINFIDTQSNDIAQIKDKVANSDIILGPLLKDTLSDVKQILMPNQILLGLNRPDNMFISEQEEFINTELQFFFGLAPEDEAKQLAEHVFAENYKQPIVIHAQDSTATRMANAFLSRWQSLSDNDNITVLPFTDNKAIRNNITQTLGVAVSQRRAKTLERYLGTEVFSVTRNRRDIDAFIVFANAKQTELINPMIEASLSTFDDTVIPVYASSRSYNHNLNQNSLRDLQNVFFIDMPWMIEQDKQPLSISHKALFPTASSNERRLFAFGYDAFSLLPQLSKLQSSPSLTFDGLSGNLSMQRNQIVRRLPLAKVTSDAIVINPSAQ